VPRSFQIACRVHPPTVNADRKMTPIGVLGTSSSH
jgi:hypothetical protein